MKGGFLKRIQGRIKIGLVMSLVGFVGTSIYLQKGSSQIKDIANLQEGIQTCFTRAHNTLTARLMGSLDSRYLSQGFTALTEECFGETVTTYESLKVTTLSALEDLNKLASDVHWFHEKALNSVSGNTLTGENPENVIVSLVSGRYEKLELLVDKVLDQLGSQKSKISSQQKKLGQLFYIFMFVIPLLAFTDWLITGRRNKVSLKREKVSQEMIANNNTSLESIVPLVEGALSESGYEKLSEAFSLANSGQSINAHHEKPQVVVSPSSISKKQIDDMWKRQPASEPVAPLEPISVESMLGDVIDHVSPKIFTQGISIDVDSETAFVDCEKEALEQTLYYIIMSSINSYSHEETNKYLSITMRKLGGTLLSVVKFNFLCL